MRRFVVRRRNPLIFVFSIVFWLIACTTVVLLILLNFLNRVNHEKKWSDYDDCGIF